MKAVIPVNMIVQIHHDLKIQIIHGLERLKICVKYHNIGMFYRILFIIVNVSNEAHHHVRKSFFFV